MKTHLFGIGAAAFALTGAAHAVVVADLEADFVAGVSEGDQFTANNWTLSDGTSPLEWDAALNAGIASDPPGYSGTEVIFGNPSLDDFPFVTDQDVFAGAAPGAGELVYHPGDATDVVITWTADQAYNDVALDYSVRRATQDNLLANGITVGGTAGAVLANTLYDTAGISGQILVGNVAAGETIVITLDSGDASASFGDPGGDQTFGNFVISDNVPEPGSLALMGLGGLLVARRRR